MTARAAQVALSLVDAPSEPDPGWLAANQRYLAAGLDLIRHRLDKNRVADGGAKAALARAAAGMTSPPALHQLRDAFGLTDFETEVLLLCAAMELEADLVPKLAERDLRSTAPTFALAMAILPGAHWSALTPSRPLRYFRLIDVAAGGAIATSPLRIDERVLHYVTGIRSLDTWLDGLVEPVPTGELVPSYEPAVEAAVEAWLRDDTSGVPVIELHGADADAQRTVAAAICARTGLTLHALPARSLSGNVDEALLARLLTREALLDRAAFLMDGDGSDPAEVAAAAAARRLIDRLSTPVLLTGRERGRRLRRPSLALEIGRPTKSEQRALFHAALGADERSSAAQGIERAIAQFDLGAPAIHEVCAVARRQDSELDVALWDACRGRARTRLDDLAHRIDARVGWSDLVASETQRQTLREIAMRVRHRTQVFEAWGFAAKSSRGLGITALFAGPSGTGKTLSAEVLAHELRLDLYRIDLSQVVSKYIGETEKNLRRVFDAAEEGASVLLFDEADALFGKRSEVKDSHDRHANIEVGYLLQRMEAYRGLAILTTNMRSALDNAFLRRLAFVVEFPMPDLSLRAEIWRRVFPAATPTDGLDFQQLGRLNLSGGNIRNVALGAAFLAADADEPVRMAHVLRAAREEYVKLERSLPAELGG